MIEKPTSAFHFDAVGGGVARNDQYYRLDVGRYNTWRGARLVQRNTPCLHVDLQVALGRDRQRPLTLRGLRPGGTTDANTTQANMLLAIVRAGLRPRADRKKSRARFDLTLPANWKAFASYAYERRRQSPFGAVFGGGGGGGNVEIPESIDYNTQDVLAGLQFANALTSVNLQAAASFFQNDIDTLMFQNPLFITTNTIAGVPTTFTQGQFDLYPSNDYYNLKGSSPGSSRSFSRAGSRASSLARSQQNDNLIPWAIEPLTGHHQRRLDGQHVEHDRLAEQAVGRCADRHDARRSASS